LPICCQVQMQDDSRIALALILLLTIAISPLARVRRVAPRLCMTRACARLVLHSSVFEWKFADCSTSVTTTRCPCLRLARERDRVRKYCRICQSSCVFANALQILIDGGGRSRAVPRSPRRTCPSIGHYSIRASEAHAQAEFVTRLFMSQVGSEQAKQARMYATSLTSVFRAEDTMWGVVR